MSPPWGDLWGDLTTMMRGELGLVDPRVVGGVDEWVCGGEGKLTEMVVLMGVVDNLGGETVDGEEVGELVGEWWEWVESFELIFKFGWIFST